ncbi:MAG: PQQ-binding-like beta-propeller repeat protein, partial [Gammaproteobacteria bacterium]|nr:PQQ-binding-like beta-propeller repeat protein [Gammaproteobacteria bacterium]
MKYLLEKLLLILAIIGPLSTAWGAEVFNPRHAPGYQQGTWSTVHGDSTNGDYVPLVVSDQLRPSWHLLEGAVLFTAAPVVADGTIYIASGRGPGYSHLHAISPQGEILWESAPQKSLDDLDSAAVISAPVVDDQGDVYISDMNQFWAFYPGGAVKWVARLDSHGIDRPFVTAMIAGDKGQYVGGISADGKVALFDRASGELAMPVLELPGKANPANDPTPAGLWEGGLMDTRIRDFAWDILNGDQYEVTNSPAVHPSTGRVFITAGGTTDQEGVVYGIDVLDRQLTIAFATAVPPESGTSPAISADGSKVYAMAQGGQLFAIDAGSGELLWQADTKAQDASPSVGPDNSLYILGGDHLVAVNGDNGEIKWRVEYSDFAATKLPRVWTRFGLIGNNGMPRSYIDSVVTVTPKKIWTSLLLGYDINLFGTKFNRTIETHMVALDPEDGSILADYPIPDTSEGGISMGRHGEVYMDILACGGSIHHYSSVGWLLPEALQVPKPKGGLVAFEPVSQRQQLALGLEWINELLSAEGGNHPLSLSRARSQLLASLESLQLAA